jgi:hypothetical protein
VEVDGSGNNCTLIFSPKTPCGSGRLYSEDRVIMSIYGGGVFSEQFKFQILYEFGTKTGSAIKGVKYTKTGDVTKPLTLLRYEGTVDLVLDTDNNVTNITYSISTSPTNVYTVGPVSLGSWVDFGELFTSYTTDGTNDVTKSLTFNQFLPKMRPEITASGNLKDLLQDEVMKCKRNDTTSSSPLKRIN